MKKFITSILLLLAVVGTFAQTKLLKTNEQFLNGKEYVWQVVDNGRVAGEFWPIHGLNLVTNQTNPDVFKEKDIKKIQEKLGGVAMAPDGMTGGSFGTFTMQGRSLAHGVSCGDGTVYNYGIVIVNNGYDITFTHNKEIGNFDSLYNSVKSSKGTLFFLPSIFRKGSFLPSSNMVDKVLVRRETFAGVQMGVVMFNCLVTYDKAREIVLGLDRSNQSNWSKTTNIYVLDGGGTWGQSVKETNGKVTVVGTRDPSKVTNYLVFY